METPTCYGCRARTDSALHEGFRSAVNDGFWLSVALPPGSDGKDAAALVSQLGAKEVSTVKESME